MKLTLRTLLAYLDDVLEPNSAREIGVKLGESHVASSLVERIRDVLKRRRIATPDVSGPGSKPNPNLVGEYLDNTLVGADVEDIERICLNSDVHLAEVAACHKILTLVLGEPVEIPRTTRERMYALGAAMPSEQAASVSGNGHATASKIESSSLRSQPSTLPAELVRPKSKGTLWVVAALLIVFGAWVGLVISDHGLLSFGGPDDVDDSALAINGDGDNGDASIPVDNDPVASVPGQDDQEIEAGLNAGVDSAGEATENTVTSVSPTAPLPEDAINPPPPVDLTEGEAMDPADATAVAVVPEAPLNTTPEAALPTPSDGNTPAVVAPTADDPLLASPGSPIQFLYTSHEDVLLHEMTEPMGWFVLPRNSEIRNGQSIACPEPFEAELLVAGATCRIELVGGTRLLSLGPSAVGSFGFDFERGAIVVRHTGMPDAAKTDFGIVVADQLMQFELMSDSILGMQVDRLPPTGLEENQILSPQVVLTMFMPQGSCRVTAASGITVDVSPEVNGELTWNSSTGELVPTVLQSRPAWYAAMGVRTGAARQTARRYEEMFLVDQPVESTVPTIMRNDDPRFAELAVRTLGLIGDYPQLARAMESGKEGSILAAADELSLWLPQDSENGDLLRSELLRNTRETEDVDVLVELLWGYDRADAMRPDVSQRLVEWLLHPNAAVRILAFKYVKGFTGISQNYHPMLQPGQLAASVNNWRDYIRRNGGALVASPQLP